MRANQRKAKQQESCTCRLIFQIFCGLISVALNSISIFSLPYLQLDIFTLAYNYCWLAGVILIGLNAFLTVTFLMFMQKCLIVMWFLLEVSLQALAVTCYILMKQQTDENVKYWCFITVILRFIFLFV